MSARTGRLIRRLDARASWLDWSPDGRWLLHSGRGRFGKLDLFVISADGRGSPRRLTRSGFRSEARAVWSPDGRKIAFVSAPGFEDASAGPGSIWTMRSDGTHKQRLHREPDVIPDVPGNPEHPDAVPNRCTSHARAAPRWVTGRERRTRRARGRTGRSPR